MTLVRGGQRQLNFSSCDFSCKVFFLEPFLFLHFKGEEGTFSLLSGPVASDRKEGNWYDVEDQ